MEVMTIEGKMLDIVYTESVDISLSDYKQSERMELFTKQFGKRFYFLDSNDRPVSYDLEETTYLSEIRRRKLNSECQVLKIQFQTGFEPNHKKLKEMEEIFEDDLEEELDEKFFLEIADLAKDVTKPVGFVFYTKNETVD